MGTIESNSFSWRCKTKTQQNCYQIGIYFVCSFIWESFVDWTMKWSHFLPFFCILGFLYFIFWNTYYEELSSTKFWCVFSLCVNNFSQWMFHKWGLQIILLKWSWKPNPKHSHVYCVDQYTFQRDWQARDHIWKIANDCNYSRRNNVQIAMVTLVEFEL